MKRSIIIFLLTFLVTAGGIGTFYYFKHKAAQQETAENTVADEPAVDTTTEETTTVTTPQEQPSATDSETTATVTEPTPTDEATTQPGEAATTESETTDTPEQPEETPQQQPEEPAITLPEGTKTNNPAHEATLLAVEHFKAEDPAKAITKLVEEKKMSPEAAAVVTDWLKENEPSGVEEIGDIRNHADGTKTYRYRVTTKDGASDLLIDVLTDKSGNNPYISAATTTPSDRTMLDASSDSMTTAEAFIQAVREGNMSKARSMVNPDTVSAATLAGLCMIFEEGTFVLSSETPIRNTVMSPSAALYLVYVVPSDNPNAPKVEANHIAMTLSRLENSWQVTGVGTDRLLDIYLMGAQKEGGRYFPIVKNPKGGESLALYFDFNDAALTPRSERQLQIVADILRESKGKLDIAGHTDDVGTEEYNLKLSERRAESVKEVLIRFGVAPEQITTKGLGKNEPRQLITETDDEARVDEKRGENRRAEIYLDFEA